MCTFRGFSRCLQSIRIFEFSLYNPLFLHISRSMFFENRFSFTKIKLSARREIYRAAKHFEFISCSLRMYESLYIHYITYIDDSIQVVTHKIWGCIFIRQGLDYRTREKNQKFPRLLRFEIFCARLALPSWSTLTYFLLRYKFSSKSVKQLVCSELLQKNYFFKISNFCNAVQEVLLHQYGVSLRICEF